MVSILRKTFAQEPSETRGPAHFPLNSIVKIVDRLVLLKLVHWIQEERLVSDIQFGFMAGKSSVDQLCRLMNDLESKKGKADFLLSIDLKGAYDRVANVKLYRKLKESGMLCQLNGTLTSFTYSSTGSSKS